MTDDTTTPQPHYPPPSTDPADTGEITPRRRLESEIERLGLTVRSEFVPWSKSRSYVKGARVGDRNLNWKVTICKDGREILTTDYSAGIGHAPSYSDPRPEFGRIRGGGISLARAEALTFETEHGLKYRGNGFTGRTPIALDPIDVIWSVLMDAEAIDHPTFETWAADCGYDPDSRKGEAIYRICLEHALKLRAAVGDQALRDLRDAGRDY